MPKAASDSFWMHHVEFKKLTTRTYENRSNATPMESVMWKYECNFASLQFVHRSDENGTQSYSLVGMAAFTSVREYLSFRIRMKIGVCKHLLQVFEMFISIILSTVESLQESNMISEFVALP